MIRRPPRSTRTYTLFPYTTLFRSDSVVLEWHHTEKNKTDNVGDLLGRKGWDKIMEEVNKCICVCSNCHKKIHYGSLKCDTV